MSRVSCPHCTRTFADQNAVWMHAKAKHRDRKTAHLRPKGDPEDESMASLFVKAEIARACGEPVEEWIEDMLS